MAGGSKEGWGGVREQGGEGLRAQKVGLFVGEGLGTRKAGAAPWEANKRGREGGQCGAALQRKAVRRHGIRVPWQSLDLQCRVRAVGPKCECA